MSKLWTQMTIEEKLDDLHDTVQRFSEIMNEAAQRGNREFSEIGRRLSMIERVLPVLGAAIVRPLDRPAVQP